MKNPDNSAKTALDSTVSQQGSKKQADLHINRLLPSIIASMPDLIFILDQHGKMIGYHAPETEKLMLPPEEFLGKDFRSILPPELIDTIEEAFSRALESGLVATVKYPLPVNDGIRYFEGRFSPFKEKNGLVFIVRDVSNQHKIENKLQSLSRLHQLIVEFSSRLFQSKLDEIDTSINITLAKLGDYAEVDRVYIFDYDLPGDVVNNTYEWCSNGTNPEIENLQGIPFSFVPRWKEKFNNREHVYIPLISEIDEEYHAEKEILEPQGIQSLLALPMFFGEKFMGFIGFDSVKRTREWSEEHIALLRLAGEIIAGSIARQKFEKEIIEARKQAESASKAKSEFLASMSHEIRTPMNAILGFSEILYNTTTDSRNKSFLSGILSSGKTLLYLINDILDLSKIEAGLLEISEEPTQLADVFREMGRIFSNSVSEKNLEFIINIPENFPRVIVVDDVRLRQLLFNLVGNAVKFTHSGFIEVAADYQSSEGGNNLVDIEISVTDTGIGIPASYQKIIFDAFVQVETDNTRQYGGTGLGLAITNRLVQMMNGTVRVESEVNKGSKFILSFKNVKTDQVLPERKNIYDWINREIIFKPATILVVDDVDFNRELARSFLSGYNFNILEAKSGQEGITIARMHRPDLILMDIRMPVMNGYEAANALKGFEETKDIVCIAFTASTMRHDEETIYRHFRDFLIKPITRNELVDCLLKYLPHTIGNKKLEEPETRINWLVDVKKYIDAHPEKSKMIGVELQKNIYPDLQQLMSYLDEELLNKMIKKIDVLCKNYEVEFCSTHLIHVQNAAENYDIERFNKEIRQFEKLMNQFTEQVDK